MILGVGTDIVQISRIEALLERFGRRFEQRCFTDNEQAYARSKQRLGTRAVASAYAKRYAAKEACMKALGAGEGMRWHDMEVINEPSGKPVLRLHGLARQQLSMMADGEAAFLHLSLSDDYPVAQAMLVMHCP